MKKIDTPSDIVHGPAFGMGTGHTGDIILVMVRRTIHIPGDERSRTNPGHGYPASTEHHWDLYQADSIAELERWCEKNEDETAILLSGRQLKATKKVEFKVG